MRGSAEKAAPGEEGINIVNSFVHQNVVRTAISQAFTSNKNVRYLMEQLQAAVFKATGKIIGPQSIMSLAEIMKYYYLTNGPFLLHLPDMEVEKLNRIVLQEIIHNTVQGVLSYDRFLRDSTSQPIPPDRPLNTNTKGSRQFEINYFI